MEVTPSHENLKELYLGDGYFSGGDSLDFGYDDYVGDRKNIERTFIRRLAHIFKENNKITGKAKLQLINFIESADTHQIKILAMDGELVPQQAIDEFVKNVVDDRFATMPHIVEALNKASLQGLQEILGTAALIVGTASVTYGVMSLRARKKCKSLFKDDSERRKTCVKDIMRKWKTSSAWRAANKQKKDKRDAAVKKMQQGLPK